LPKIVFPASFFRIYSSSGGFFLGAKHSVILASSSGQSPELSVLNISSLLKLQRGSPETLLKSLNYLLGRRVYILSTNVGRSPFQAGSRFISVTGSRSYLFGAEKRQLAYCLQMQFCRHLEFFLNFKRAVSG
jgi:hypothetical protein